MGFEFQIIINSEMMGFGSFGFFLACWSSFDYNILTSDTNFCENEGIVYIRSEQPNIDIPLLSTEVINWIDSVNLIFENFGDLWK